MGAGDPAGRIVAETHRGIAEAVAGYSSIQIDVSMGRETIAQGEAGDAAKRRIAARKFGGVHSSEHG